MVDPIIEDVLIKLKIRELGVRGYQSTLAEMKKFTANREQDTPDEVWILEHLPVYTQGTSCRDMPSQNNLCIPIVHSDRGGQMTYHGPGQLIIYLLMDIKRLGTGPKSFVNLIERLVIEALSEFSIDADRRNGAPGVYVSGRKVAALGLRISRGCCYHGISINVNMDLSPFTDIVPCGLEGIEIAQISDYHPGIDVVTVKQIFKQKINDYFAPPVVQ